MQTRTEVICMSNIRKAKHFQKSDRNLFGRSEILRVQKSKCRRWLVAAKTHKAFLYFGEFPPLRVFILFSSEIIYFAPRKAAENSIIVMNQNDEAFDSGSHFQVFPRRHLSHRINVIKNTNSGLGLISLKTSKNMIQMS